MPHGAAGQAPTSDVDPGERLAGFLVGATPAVDQLVS